MDARSEGRLPVLQRWSYGVGHVLNDLCASMWFSYLLVFFHYVIRFSNEMAGYLLLLGQIADALATPFIGIEADRSKGICGYGKRKSWHLIGCICVVLSFPFLFNQCIGCALCDPEKPSVFKESCWVQFAYYAPFVVIFQFGWAATQVAHLSLIPGLTSSENIRVELNAFRYAFTVISSIVVYLIAWVLLRSYSSTSESVGPEDASVFRILSLSVVGIGIVFCVVFHLGTSEKRRDVPAETNHCKDFHTASSSQSDKNQGMIWKDWFKEIQFYQVAMLYMCTRLVVNISQIYMPMYLTDSLNLEQHYIAAIPLTVYLSGFVSSLSMGPVNKLIGRKATYTIGCVVVFGACVWFWFISQSAMKKQVIGAAIVLGSGASTILVTSLSMTADLIGNHKESSAFVYGAMSFTDKLSNGLAVLAIQQLHPCRDCGDCSSVSEEDVRFLLKFVIMMTFYYWLWDLEYTVFLMCTVHRPTALRNDCFYVIFGGGLAITFLSAACCAACTWYYRDVLVFVVGGFTVAAFLILMTLSRSKLGNLKKFPCTESSERDPLISNTDDRRSSSQSISGKVCEKLVCCSQSSASNTEASSNETDQESERIRCTEQTGLLSGTQSD